MCENFRNTTLTQAAHAPSPALQLDTAQCQLDTPVMGGQIESGSSSGQKYTGCQGFVSVM